MKLFQGMKLRCLSVPDQAIFKKVCSDGEVVEVVGLEPQVVRIATARGMVFGISRWYFDARQSCWQVTPETQRPLPQQPA